MKPIRQWLGERPDRTLVVMARVNFQKSFPARLTRAEAFRFADAVGNECILTKELDSHTLQVGIEST